MSRLHHITIDGVDVTAYVVAVDIKAEADEWLDYDFLVTQPTQRLTIEMILSGPIRYRGDGRIVDTREIAPGRLALGPESG